MFKEQYFHFRNKSIYDEEKTEGTLAVMVPNRSFLDHFFTSHANETLLKVGLAVKSKKDQFNKKTGREKSQSKMNFLKLTLEKVDIIGTKHVYTFYSSELEHNKKKYELYIKLTTVAESEQVNLVAADLYKIERDKRC